MNGEAESTLSFQCCLGQVWLYFWNLSLDDIFKAQPYLKVR